MRTRFSVAKAQLLPWLGGNTWAYTRIEHIAAACDHADPAIGQHTVQGLPIDGAVHTGVTIQGTALVADYLSRESKPSAPKRKGRSRQPTADAMSGTDPFITYLWDAQAELSANRTSNDACPSDNTAFRDTVFETYKAAARICDTPWHPSEIAQHPWRQDLVEWAAPQALGAYTPPAVDALVASANDRHAVIHHQRTLKQVLRVMALFQVPVTHVHVEVRIPRHWSPARADKRVKEFERAASASPHAIGHRSRTPETRNDVALHLRVTDPRTPWQGLLSACAWMQPWLSPDRGNR